MGKTKRQNNNEKKKTQKQMHSIWKEVKTKQEMIVRAIILKWGCMAVVMYR